MRLLIDDRCWFNAAWDDLAGEHDVVCLSRDQVRTLWQSPQPDGWRALVPARWEPDVALFTSPEYHLAPPFLRELPCPVALWICDWYIGAQTTLWLADQADLLLADATGVAALQRLGIAHVDECCPWIFDSAVHRPDWDAEPLWDVGFLGSLNDDIHFRRNRWLARAARLDRRHRVQLRSGLHGEDYTRFVQRCRLTFNVSVTGDVNMRCFEAAACGSPVLIDAAAVDEVSRWFAPGEEIVVYTEDDLEDVVAELLADEPRRRAIARAAHARVLEHAHAPRLRGLLARLEALASAGRRPGAPERTPLIDRVAAAMSFPDPASLGGCEMLLEQAGGDHDPQAQLARAAVYFRYAAEHPEQAADAAAWAGEHLSAARALAPDDAVATLDLMHLAQAAGAPDAAQTLARQLVDGIDGGTMHARPGRLLLQTTNVRPGYRWQEAVLGGDAAPAELGRLVRVAALETLGDLDSLRRAVALDPGEPLPRLRLALALLEAGDAAEAAAEAEGVVAARPLRADAWRLLVVALVAAGRDADAGARADELGALAERLPHLAAVAEDARSRAGRPV